MTATVVPGWFVSVTLNRSDLIGTGTAALPAAAVITLVLSSDGVTATTPVGTVTRLVRVDANGLIAAVRLRLSRKDRHSGRRLVVRWP